jgi:hypothetical protein
VLFRSFYLWLKQRELRHGRSRLVRLTAKKMARTFGSSMARMLSMCMSFLNPQCQCKVGSTEPCHFHEKMGSGTHENYPDSANFLVARVEDF